MRELGMKPSTRLMERDIVTDRTLSSLFERPTTCAISASGAGTTGRWHAAVAGSGLV